MTIDLRWDLMTNASANFGNALVNAASQIRQRREQHRDRSALRNYLQNPDDAAAFNSLAERRPDTAFRLRDEQLQRARQLRADQREQLLFGARLLEGVTDDAGYQRALGMARQAGIDTSGLPASYDVAFVGQIRDLAQRINPTEPVRLGEGDQLVDPRTGRVIAHGTPRQRWHSIPPGGRLVAEPGIGQPSPPDVPVPAPGTVEDGYRFRGGNPADPNNWEPVQGGPQARPAATFPGTR